jgi:hypothetical protein
MPTVTDDGDDDSMPDKNGKRSKGLGGVKEVKTLQDTEILLVQGIIGCGRPLERKALC